MKSSHSHREIFLSQKFIILLCLHLHSRSVCTQITLSITGKIMIISPPEWLVATATIFNINTEVVFSLFLDFRWNVRSTDWRNLTILVYGNTGWKISKIKWLFESDLRYFSCWYCPWRQKYSIKKQKLNWNPTYGPGKSQIMVFLFLGSWLNLSFHWKGPSLIFIKSLFRSLSAEFMFWTTALFSKMTTNLISMLTKEFVWTY